MTDLFMSHRPDLGAPADIALAITPSDTADLPVSSRALYVGFTGDVRVTTVAGHTVTFANVPAGSILPVRTRRVFDTGTTATNIVALA